MITVTDQFAPEKIQEQILGILMMASPGELTTCIAQLQPKYFTNPFNRRVYEIIVKQFNEGIKPDLLTVIKAIREKGEDKGSVARISGMTSGSIVQVYRFSDALAHLVSNYNQQNVVNFLVRNQRRLENGHLTPDVFFDEMKILEEEFNANSFEEEEDNYQTIDKVLISHEDAKNGNMPGITIGHTVLSDIVMLEPVDVMVIGAKPAMGKTAFGVTTCVNLAFSDNKKIAVFCIEMSKVQFIRRVLGCMASVNTDKIRKGKCTPEELARITAAKNRPEWKNIHIYTGDHTTAEIAGKCSYLKHNGGLDLIIVDYLQKVTSSLSPSSNETEKVKQVSNDLKRISHRLEVPQIQFAQLQKNSGKDGNRPTLPDLKQTGDIEQDASIVAFLHRPEYYGHKTMPNSERLSKGICEFIIAKNREDSLGIKEFIFEPWYNKFSSHFGSSSDEVSKTDDKDMPF